LGCARQPQLAVRQGTRQRLLRRHAAAGKVNPLQLQRQALSGRMWLAAAAAGGRRLVVAAAMVPAALALAAEEARRAAAEAGKTQCAGSRGEREAEAAAAGIEGCACDTMRRRKMPRGDAAWATQHDTPEADTRMQAGRAPLYSCVRSAPLHPALPSQRAAI
jgi:hypothetical protein